MLKRKLYVFVKLLSGYLKYYLLVIVWLTRLLSLESRYKITDAVSILAYFLLAGKRHSVKKNLATICNTAVNNDSVKRVFCDYGRYWAELANIHQFWNKSTRIFYGPDFPPAGSCFLGLTFHIGNFECFGNVFHDSSKLTINVVVERLKPDVLSHFFVKLRSTYHIKTIAHDDLRGIVNVLHRREPLGILCDRLIGGEGTETEFFGKKKRLPLSIARYAYDNYIPIYIAYCIRNSGVISVYCQKIDSEGTFDEVVKRVMIIMESTIKQYPYQWHNLSAL